MTKQEFLELYGKSVYQVRLEIASHLWCGGTERVADCLLSADVFVEALLEENLKRLEGSYD